MARKIRHQLFLSEALTARFEALAAKPGMTKSAMLEEALAHWLTAKGKGEIDDQYGFRLDRLTAAVSRVERASHILLETLALFVRYELAIHPPLAENDQAGRAKGRERFALFIEQVGQAVASGKQTLGTPQEQAR